MEKVFERSLNVKGGYAVNLFSLGVPHTVVVDDYIPVKKNKKPIFAELSVDESLWPMILEKAFAKIQGNYLHIAGGYPEVATRFMTGAPWDEKETKYMTVDEIWNYLSSNLSAGNFVNCSTGGEDDKHTDKWGIA